MPAVRRIFALAAVGSVLLAGAVLLLSNAPVEADPG